ncbi:MAG: hypothetical protein JRD89_13610, partial [Deltaproteobacteria bacterium]|nr:hypothetical protein [Deltaproteobacteria bacterium]
NYDSPEDPTDATHNNYKFSIYCTYTVEAPAVSISVTPTSYDFGFLDLNSVSSTGTAGYFNITNEGTGDINLTIKSSNATDGTNIWVLAETNGPDQYTLQQSTNGTDWYYVTLSESTLATYVGASENVTMDLKITTPTSTQSYQKYNFTVTIRGVAA